eukprot:CAMPEP_0114631228 /NCGR_PEP_ID=MMETSP0168-20121206/14299_1 /TAXON_ID=95228 ORGANISM="Vannella sp., Strain DIVA3 517/6/12" /NCGR_SAMPLE_ID=MMETSP0168 /ASSEMBLY_ACC=CAM_ASM_000044 /LENGTH=54 /DNA_ID=CAMNT_0001842777 /DNA_START=51 /DNA_END=212 /DNA_ORIENTATION=-
MREALEAGEEQVLAEVRQERNGGEWAIELDCAGPQHCLAAVCLERLQRLRKALA